MARLCVGAGFIINVNPYPDIPKPAPTKCSVCRGGFHYYLLKWCVTLPYWTDTAKIVE
jgi:hypothetical protein